jgi:DNA invertase Pin-like site-specific DNA recombinase
VRERRPRDRGAEYIDHESGRKGSDKRKRFAALFEDASRRKFDLVLFWALDRFSREGIVRAINYLQRLDSYGIAFHSYTEAHLATDNELVRNVLLAVMSSLAKVEAEKISERVKAGLQRVVASATRSISCSGYRRIFRTAALRISPDFS